VLKLSKIEVHIYKNTSPPTQASLNVTLRGKYACQTKGVGITFVIPRLRRLSRRFAPHNEIGLVYYSVYNLES
jgi:hypothetical protein